MKRRSLLVLLLLASVAAARAGDGASATKPAKLPKATSRYNVGNLPGRYRDAKGQLRHFALKHTTPLYDGSGREIGTLTEPVLLNIGVAKDMDVSGSGRTESLAWAWATKAGSGWVARSALVDPPKPDADPARDPKQPKESKEAMTIDCAAGREKLKGLRHVGSSGEIPEGSGNMGEHYAGRNPGDKDYVYLLLACPNVIRGGVAKDSIPNGEKFIEGLDENGQPITETMTMYKGGDLNQPVKVTFLYGRTATSNGWGWLARANVRER